VKHRENVLENRIHHSNQIHLDKPNQSIKENSNLNELASNHLEQPNSSFVKSLEKDHKIQELHNQQKQIHQDQKLNEYSEGKIDHEMNQEKNNIPSKNEKNSNNHLKNSFNGMKDNNYISSESNQIDLTNMNKKSNNRIKTNLNCSKKKILSNLIQNKDLSNHHHNIESDKIQHLSDQRYIKYMENENTHNELNHNNQITGNNMNSLESSNSNNFNKIDILQNHNDHEIENILNSNENINTSSNLENRNPRTPDINQHNNINYNRKSSAFNNHHINYNNEIHNNNEQIVNKSTHFPRDIINHQESHSNTNIKHNNHEKKNNEIPLPPDYVKEYDGNENNEENNDQNETENQELNNNMPTPEDPHKFNVNVSQQQKKNYLRGSEKNNNKIRLPFSANTVNSDNEQPNHEINKMNQNAEFPSDQMDSPENPINQLPETVNLQKVNSPNNNHIYNNTYSFKENLGDEINKKIKNKKIQLRMDLK